MSLPSVLHGYLFHLLLTHELKSQIQVIEFLQEPASILQQTYL